MFWLSNIPRGHAALRASNDYGAALVAAHPTRFGLLAALPTDDAGAALAELERVHRADGFAVTATYNGLSLGDPSLDRLWAELDRRRATVFAHPYAYGPAVQCRPLPLIEVAFDTAAMATPHALAPALAITTRASCSRPPPRASRPRASRSAGRASGFHATVPERGESYRDTTLSSASPTMISAFF